MIRFTACVLTMVCLSGLAEAAEDAPAADSQVTMGDAFGRFGYQDDKASVFRKDACNVGFDLDQRKFLETVPDLQKIGLLNSELTQAKINTLPNTLSFAFLVQLLPTAVKTTYENHADVDKCRFTQYLTRVDDFGNDKREVAATFNFSRDLYKKINWAKFEAQKLAKIAPGFKFSPTLMAQVGAEN